MRLFSHFRKHLVGGGAGRHTVRRMLRLIPVLLLNLAIAIPVTASTVAPAPPATIFIVPTTFDMSLKVPGRVCAGSNYPATVLVRIDLQIPAAGTTVQASDAIVPGIVINASSNSPGVATISPPRMESSVLGVGSILGAVTFTLNAIRAGDASVNFHADIPAQITQGDPGPIDNAWALRVDNCTYRVSENGSWSKTFPNLRTTLTDSLRGQITKEATGGLLRGTGDVTWSLRSFSVMCSHSHSLTLDHADMVGQPHDENLTVSIAFGPVGFSTVNCGSSNNGSFEPPAIRRDGASSGFTAGAPSTVQVGDFQLAGHWTMSVTPVIH